MAVGLPENAPKFEASVEGLVARSYASLHREILGGVAVVVRTFYLVRVADVPVVGFDPLSWLEKVSELVHEDLDVRPGAGGVGPLHPDEIPLQYVDAELVSERRLARILVGTKGVPLHGDPLLLDAEVGAVDCHETIVQLVVDKTALEVDLWFRERATTMQRRW